MENSDMEYYDCIQRGSGETDSSVEELSLPCTFMETSSKLMTSFTPIKHGHFQTVDPKKILLRRTLNRDILCDLNESGEPRDSYRKSSSVKRQKTSSKHTQQKVDCESRLSESVEFQVESPSRECLSAIEKQLQVFEGRVEAHSHNKAEDRVDHALHFPSLPATDKRRKVKEASVTLKLKANNKPAFKNLAITKLISSRKKSIEYKHSISPSQLNQYQGFTTTEQVVKSTSNGVAKTTLEKLSAFRYTPLASDKQPCFDVSRRTLEPGMQFPDQRLLGDLNVDTDTLCDTEMTCGDDSDFFRQAIWHTSVEPDPAALQMNELQLNNNARAGINPECIVKATNRQPSVHHMLCFGSADSKDTSLEMAQSLPSNQTQAAFPHRDPIFSMSTNLDNINMCGVIELTGKASEQHYIKQAVATSDMSHRPTQTPEDQYYVELSLGSNTHAPYVPIIDGDIEDLTEREALTTSPISTELHALPIAAERLHVLDNSEALKTPAQIPFSVISGQSPVAHLTGRVNLDHLVYDPHVQPLLQDLSSSREFAHDEGIDDEELLVIDIPGVSPQVRAIPLDGGDEFDDDGVDDEALLAIHIPQTKPHVRPDDKPFSLMPVNQQKIEDWQCLRLSMSRLDSSAAEIPIPGPHHASTTHPDEDEYLIDDDEEANFLHFAYAEPSLCGDLVPPTSVQNASDIQREVYDSSLQFSPPKLEGSGRETSEKDGFTSPSIFDIDVLPPGREEDWTFISASNHCKNQTKPPPTFKTMITKSCERVALTPQPLSPATKQTLTSSAQAINFPSPSLIDDSHEYEPLKPFVRPPFPSLIMDRCPVGGLSAQTFLRTCFRIGEMYHVGSSCNKEKLNAVVELFARVNFSSREPGTTKQHFQFMDLWHDRAPYPNGIIKNYQTSGLAESESRAFLTKPGVEKLMARVLGRFTRDVKNSCWLLHIINIRKTDWEEIKWTKRVVSGDDLAEKVGLSRLLKS